MLAKSPRDLKLWWMTRKNDAHNALTLLTLLKLARSIFVRRDR